MAIRKASVLVLYLQGITGIDSGGRPDRKRQAPNLTPDGAAHERQRLLVVSADYAPIGCVQHGAKAEELE
jgi:hypothetical protein